MTAQTSCRSCGTNRWTEIDLNDLGRLATQSGRSFPDAGEAATIWTRLRPPVRVCAECQTFERANDEHRAREWLMHLPPAAP